MKYVLLAVVHCDGADDYPFSVCLGPLDGMAEAEGVAVEVLKMFGSKDLTDFKVFESPLGEECLKCERRDECVEVIEDEE